MCIFSRPVPDILWYRDNVLIADSGDRFQHQDYNRTLRLGSLSSATHDGDYKCVANSGLLRVETSFIVKVIGMDTPLVWKHSRGKENIKSTTCLWGRVKTNL